MVSDRGPWPGAPQRMYAHGDAQPHVALGQLECGAGRGDAGRRDYRTRDTRGRGTLHDRVPIGGEARVVQVAVGVDQRGRHGAGPENGGHRALPQAPFSWSFESRSDRGASPARARRATGSGTDGVPPRRVATNAA